MIRQAVRSDAVKAVPLILQAIGHIAFVLTGTTDGQETASILNDFFGQEDTRISYQNALVMEEEGELVRSVATLQSPRDRPTGCSSWHLRFAVYSSGGNLSRRSFCWRWDGTCAFPSLTATSRSCSPSGVCTPTTSRCGDGFSGMRPNCSGACAAT